jgi:2,3-bisphosphoglycerate-dependent phosphoglycerate mutase
MKVYFVRHGLSTFGEGRHQLPNTHLSDQGLQEAGAVARRFMHLPIDLILSSSYTRALQTAQEIEKIKSVPLIQSDLLIERKMPSLFLGKQVDDPEIVPIHQSMRDHFYDPQWHYSDEENFADLLSRTKAALELMLSQQKENIVVVTHGYFLTVMIYVILFGENADSQTFKSFREHTANSNTGLTLCEYENNNWKLLTWNDIAHLGEE